jgi:hypothetical protein
MNVLAAPSPASPRIPELLYAQFQSQFAAVAIGILLGCVAERARIFPTIIFTFVWLTLVYCPMVHPSPCFADLRLVGFGILLGGRSNGVSLILPVVDLLRSPAEWAHLHIPSFLVHAREVAPTESSNHIDLTVSPMLCSVQLSCGSDGLDSMRDLLWARIFELSWPSW